jgi:inositol phosphorylceramide mannosyltransferase catalytic subunit
LPLRTTRPPDGRNEDESHSTDLCSVCGTDSTRLARGVVNIPRRIIQTGKSHSLTLKQRAFVANLQLLNRDYEWCFFDDGEVARFVADEYPQYRGVFDQYAHAIQRVDFFRYLAVHRLGGFYFDLDVLLAANLGPLLPLGCVFPFEGLTFSKLLRSRGMDWEIGNYAFGATAGHPFLNAVIENCARAQRDTKWCRQMLGGVPPLSKPEHEILYSTGPGIVSRTWCEETAAAASVTVLFPDDVCDVAAWNRFGEFGVHLMDGSWRSEGTFLRRRLAQRWEVFRVRQLVERRRAEGRRARPVASPACNS